MCNGALIKVCRKLHKVCRKLHTSGACRAAGRGAGCARLETVWGSSGARGCVRRGAGPLGRVRLRASASSHGAFQKSSASVHIFCSLPADLSSPPDLSAMPAAKRKRSGGGNRNTAVKRSAKAPDKNDHYATLDISPEERDKIVKWDDEMDGEDRSNKAIKLRFVTLARRYHPDKEGGTTAKQAQLNEAYEILGGYGYGGADAPGDGDGDDYGGGGGWNGGGCWND